MHQSSHSRLMLLTSLLQEWPLCAVADDQPLSGADVVDWLPQLEERLREALSGADPLEGAQLPLVYAELAPGEATPITTESALREIVQATVNDVLYTYRDAAGQHFTVRIDAVSLVPAARSSDPPP